MLETNPRLGLLPLGIGADARLVIARDRCKGCELCISVCPKHILELERTVVNVLGHHPVRLTDPAACTSCGLCARVCPDVAFTIYAPRKRGLA